VVGKERYPGPPIWGWGVEMRFSPLENLVVYIPWQQVARWSEIGPKHRKRRRRRRRRRKGSIYLLIYNVFSDDFNGVCIVCLVWSGRMISEY